jgi:hypothetical protein
MNDSRSQNLNDVSRHLSNQGGDAGREETDKSARRQAAVRSALLDFTFNPEN